MLVNREAGAFSPNVWRIMTGRYTAVFHGIDAFGRKLRPPYPEEVPSIRWLAYGSSITHGGAATKYDLCYVQQAARRLGVDALNLGLSGSCLCEKEAADFIADREDWDLATLELGVNMRTLFTPEQFRERAEYLIGKAIRMQPGKPVAVITIFPNAATFTVSESQSSRNEAEFNRILRDIVAEFRQPSLHLIEGSEVMNDFSSLAFDLLHPSDFGHMMMGQHLAAKLASILPTKE
jgi:lysophospholipase L1-like esterase